MNRYASPIDLNNSNQSWTRLIEWAGTGKQVLDVGCGRGQIGRILNAQSGCTVTGLEINPDFARECVGYQNIVLGSAEDAALLGAIGQRFDVIICGDVLEHLRQPEIPLRAFHTLLAPGGRVLISVPNVAQIRIRLMLLRGQWTYASEGIMDETHLRWFTLKTLRQLVTACGWREESFDYTLGPNFVHYLKRLRLRKAWLPSTLLAAQLLLNLSAA